MKKTAKIHLFHPFLGLAPACRPLLTGREFKAVEHFSAVTCKHCMWLIQSDPKWAKGIFTNAMPPCN